MASPSKTFPAKTPALSYAEQAKKAQIIKPPNSAPSRKAFPPPPPPPPAASDTSTTSSNGNLSNFSASKASSNANSSADNTPGSSIILTTRSSSPTPPVSGIVDHKLTNGDSRASIDLTSKALSIVAAHTSHQKLPHVNVWNVRKEKMAQDQAARTQSQFPSLPASQSMPSKFNYVPHNHTSPNLPPRLSNHVPNALMSIKLPNGKVEADNDDPFVVRLPPQLNQANLQTSMDNVESWPEVGKSIAYNTSQSFSSAQAVESLDENEKSSTVQPHPVTTKKSEKPKWVPIPPEELQAAADALQSSILRTHSRASSQKHSSNPRNLSDDNDNVSGHGSGSGQRPSRSHSGRNSQSQSVSQSRVQSRAGSLQSSPLNSRSRRLPGDDVTGVSGYQNPTTRSSRAASPRIQSPPNLDPLIAVTSPIPVVYPHPMYAPAPQVPNGIPYYQQSFHRSPFSMEQSLPHQLNQQPQHYLHSSSQSSLLTLSDGFHPNQNSHPVAPPAPPQGYSIPGSPYQVYSPQGTYEYPSGPVPYMYWSAQGRTSSGQSPIYPPHPPAVQQFPLPPPQEILPLPSATFNRSLLPDECDAVNRSKEASIVPQLKNELSQLNIEDQPVMFGSIGLLGASTCPSPALPSGEDDRREDGKDGINEKSFTMFSIGMVPGEPTPMRLRSRTRSGKAKAGDRLAVGSADGHVITGEKATGDVKNTEPYKLEAKIIDLTDPETKWEFGTTTTTTTRQSEDGPIDPEEGLSHSPQILEVQSENAPSSSDIASLALVQGPTFQPIEPTNHLLVTLLPQETPVFPLLDVNPSPPQEGAERGDEFEVKDFGYGFGPVSGSGYAPAIVREERIAREKERLREIEREKAQMMRERQREIDLERRERDSEKESKEQARDIEFPGRPRRGSYTGGGYGGYERGGYGGRRGRSAAGGGYGRTAFTRARGGHQSQPRQPPAFNVTPPPFFQPLDPTNGYYGPPHPQQLTAYIPAIAYQPQPQPLVTPPMPMPLSPLSFPLDLTRWYLLGQLEYYLSPQNMAQDFFLRQRMDSQGWIPISLIASFNRVRQLTMDVQLVKNVLKLSSVVQVKEGWVRMGGWEQFVLPDAVQSIVERPKAEQPYGDEEGVKHHDTVAEVETEVEHDNVAEREAEGVGEFDSEVEEEDEDVVFVMGREAALWSPERRQS